MTVLEKGIYLVEGRYVVCKICGKRMYRYGRGGMAMLSHGRKHVREGRAVEIALPSPRSVGGKDILFEMNTQPQG